ncbi:MAG: hypothetical protein IAF94_16890 [Pirellulaceae bacterium]|nr:hypothetical protein [Pirellulaceae bacterium]
MSKTAILLAGLLAFASAPVFAQVVVTSRPVVTYYTPTAPVVTYYAPSYSGYSSSRVVYDAPVTVSRPVTTYYAPLSEAVPVTSYYAPTYSVQPTTYYAPVTTYYGGAYATPLYGSPVTVGRSAYGTLRPYVPGQPVRNTLRFALP